MSRVFSTLADGSGNRYFYDLEVAPTPPSENTGRLFFNLKDGTGRRLFFNLQSGFESGFTLSAAKGTFSLSGKDATIVHAGAYSITAAAGTFTLTGSEALRDIGLGANQATFTMTGQAANLSRAFTLVASAATFTGTYRDISLTYSGAGPKTLVAAQGSCIFTGVTASVVRAAKLVCDTGTYSLQGYTIVGGTSPDRGTKSTGVLKVRKILVVSPSGRTKWVSYIPVKQVTSPTTGTTDNNGAIEVKLLTSGTGLTEWVDYIPVVEVTDAEVKKWRYDNIGWIPIILVE